MVVDRRLVRLAQPILLPEQVRLEGDLIVRRQAQHALHALVLAAPCEQRLLALSLRMPEGLGVVQVDLELSLLQAGKLVEALDDVSAVSYRSALERCGGAPLVDHELGRCRGDLDLERLDVPREGADLQWISSCSRKVPWIVHLNSISSLALVSHLQPIFHLSATTRLLIFSRGSQSPSFSVRVYCLSSHFLSE